MPLTSELISKFVKSTKDNNTNKNKETFAHGEIVKDLNGRYCVKIYGSETLTPVSIPTNVRLNQPVTVMIKNHTATVIGNVNVSDGNNNDTEDVLNSTSKAVEYDSIEDEFIDGLWTNYDNYGKE